MSMCSAVLLFLPGGKPVVLSLSLGLRNRHAKVLWFYLHK